MTGLDQVASELFEILQSYNYTVQLFDENGAAVYDDVENARRMFAKDGNILLSLTDDGENSECKLLIGNSVDINSIEGLVQALRTCCNLKYALNFSFQRYDRAITLKDADLISETIKRGNTMNIFEGLYGTSRSSYLKLENARMIIKHSSKIDENKHGARGRCIESIFIENAQGERMLFPTRSLLPARAMAQHVSMGGGFADQVANQIGRMAGDFQNLATCSQHILNNGAALSEGATAVREACKKKMSNMRKTFEKMSRPNGYTVEAAKMIEMANALIEGNDPDAVEPEKIEEVRSIISLEGVNLSDDLIETVCRALKDDNEITEAKGWKKDSHKLDAMNSVTIFGRQIGTDVWNNLRDGKVEFTHNFASVPSGYSKGRDDSSLVTRLHTIIPAIADDRLMNLMVAVAEYLEGGDTKYREQMTRLSNAVLRAAGNAGGGRTEPAKLPAVVEYFNWFNNLSPRNVFLKEYDGMSPRHSMGDNPYDDENGDRRDDISDQVTRDFDIAEFCDNYAEENGLSDDSLDPEERVVETDHLVSSIENRLLVDFSAADDEIDPPSDMTAEAKTLLPKVVQRFEAMGFVVNEDVDEEDADPWNDDKADNFDLMDTIHRLSDESGIDDYPEDDIESMMGIREFVDTKKKILKTKKRI
jgi:hypothetical protein